MNSLYSLATSLEFKIKSWIDSIKIEDLIHSFEIDKFVIFKIKFFVNLSGLWLLISLIINFGYDLNNLLIKNTKSDCNF